MTILFSALEDEYNKLWTTMEVRPGKEPTVYAIAKRLYTNKARYQKVQEQTGVPWFVIAAWHNRESDASFNTQLAQGDPLHGVSHNVPAGRGPFDTWEDGAYDALVTLKHLDNVKVWSPAMICYQTERYNGFGYRNNHPEVKSPYLWSFTNHYGSGKYVSDGVFSSEATDKQCGAMPIMKALIAMEGTKPLPEPKPKPKPNPVPPAVVGGIGAAIAAYASKHGFDVGIGIAVALTLIGLGVYVWKRQE